MVIRKKSEFFGCFSIQLKNQHFVSMWVSGCVWVCVWGGGNHHGVPKNDKSPSLAEQSNWFGCLIELLTVASFSTTNCYEYLNALNTVCG